MTLIAKISWIGIKWCTFIHTPLLNHAPIWGGGEKFCKGIDFYLISCLYFVVLLYSASFPLFYSYTTRKLKQLPLSIFMLSYLAPLPLFLFSLYRLILFHKGKRVTQSISQREYKPQCLKQTLLSIRQQPQLGPDFFFTCSYPPTVSNFIYCLIASIWKTGIQNKTRYHLGITNMQQAQAWLIWLF